MSKLDDRTCAECRRIAPPEESDDFLEWEALGAEGRKIVCPSCVSTGRYVVQAPFDGPFEVEWMDPPPAD